MKSGQALAQMTLSPFVRVMGSRLTRSTCVTDVGQLVNLSMYACRGFRVMRICRSRV